MMIRLWILHKSYNTKRWWRNMDNRTLDYLHIGEDNHMRFIHMNKKCRIDCVGQYPKVFKYW